MASRNEVPQKTKKKCKVHNWLEGIRKLLGEIAKWLFIFAGSLVHISNSGKTFGKSITCEKLGRIKMYLINLCQRTSSFEAKYCVGLTFIM